jgi:hypothetical protein
MDVHPRHPERPPGVTATLAAACTAGAAALHFVAAGSHAGSGVDVAVFSAVAWVQLALAALLVLRPSRGALAATAALSLAVIGGWVASRTDGLPWGAHRDVAEDVGAADLLASTLEAAVVLLALVPGTVMTTARTARAIGVAALLSVGAMATVAAATGEAAHDHGHDHALGGDEADAHDHGAEAAAGHDDDDHVAVPDDDGHAGHVTHECTAPVTAQQQAAADELVAVTRAEVQRYDDLAVALAEGYVPITPEEAQIVHYAKPSALGDGETLDPTDVESLVYGFDRKRTPYFLGAMYLLDDVDAVPPMPGGCLTSWHAHDNLCLASGRGMVATVSARGECPEGSTNTTTPMMLHVWSLDLPTGPFSELHELRPQDVVAAIVARG